MSIFDTIKTDIGEAVKWVEDEAVAVWGYFKAAVTAFSLQSRPSATVADIAASQPAFRQPTRLHWWRQVAQCPMPRLCRLRVGMIQPPRQQSESPRLSPLNPPARQ